jgi:hypothetical protein
MNLTLASLAKNINYVQAGVSEEADWLKQNVEEYSSEIPSQTFDWVKSHQYRVLELFEECNKPGWDGYDACPVSEDAKRGAWLLLKLLPRGILPPDIIPEPDGKIALEWDLGKDMLLSLSVEGQQIIYAGILGAGNNIHGKAQFSHTQALPDEIERALSLYFAQV